MDGSPLSQSPFSELWDAHELLGRDFLSQIYHSPVYLSRLRSRDLCSFSHWITTVVVVDFDVNEGHRVGEEYPPNVLTHHEKERLVRVSLPDSNAMADSGLKFQLMTKSSSPKVADTKQRSSSPNYRFVSSDGFAETPNDACSSRQDESSQRPDQSFLNGPSEDVKTPLLIQSSSNWLCIRLRHDSCLSLTHSSVSDQRFSIGAGIFRSVTDNNNRRRAKQESVVVLSPLPIPYFVPLLLPLAVFIANAYFVHGSSAIYDACASIGIWPMPPIKPLPLVLDVYLSMSSESLHLEIPTQTSLTNSPPLPSPKPKPARRSPTSQMAKLFRFNPKKSNRIKESSKVSSQFVPPRRNSSRINKPDLASISCSISSNNSPSSAPTPYGPRGSTSSSVDTFPAFIPSTETLSPANQSPREHDETRYWTPRAIVALWSLIRPSNGLDRTPSPQSRSAILKSASQELSQGHTRSCQLSSDTSIQRSNQNESSDDSDDEIESVLSSLSSLFALDPSPLRSCSLPHSLISPLLLSRHITSSTSDVCLVSQSSSLPPQQDQRPHILRSESSSSAPLLHQSPDFGSAATTPKQDCRDAHSLMSLESESPFEGVSWGKNEMGIGQHEIIPRASQIVNFEKEVSVLEEVPFQKQKRSQSQRISTASQDSQTAKQMISELSQSDDLNPTELHPHFRRRQPRKNRTRPPSRLGYLRSALRQLLEERMGRHRTFATPSAIDAIQTGASLAMPCSVSSPGLISVLGPISICIWTLWELVITGAPLLVLTSNATRSSSVVLALLNLIQPLQYGGDFRPYINSFDPDLVHYQESSQRVSGHGLKPILFGASDPHLLTVFSCCPNVTVIEAPKSLFALASTPALPALSRSRTAFPLAQSSFGAAALAFRHDSTGTATRGGGVQIRTSWLKLSHDGSVPKDAKLAKRISDTVFPPTPDLASLIGNLGQIGSQLGMSTGPATPLPITEDLERTVSEYFYDLTVKFLKPFDVYLQTDLRGLMLNPLQEAPRPTAFVPEAFLETIGSSSAPVFPPFSRLPRTKVASLYRQFISTRTFRVWFCEAQSANQTIIKRTQFSYCAAINPTSLFPRLSLNELAEGCANLRHLLRECQNVCPSEEVLKVRFIAVELKKLISDSFATVSPNGKPRRSSDAWVQDKDPRLMSMSRQSSREDAQICLFDLPPCYPSQTVKRGRRREKEDQTTNYHPSMEKEMVYSVVDLTSSEDSVTTDNLRKSTGQYFKRMSSASLTNSDQEYHSADEDGTL